MLVSSSGGRLSLVGFAPPSLLPFLRNRYQTADCNTQKPKAVEHASGLAADFEAYSLKYLFLFPAGGI